MGQTWGSHVCNFFPVRVRPLMVWDGHTQTVPTYWYGRICRSVGVVDFKGQGSGIYVPVPFVVCWDTWMCIYQYSCSTTPTVPRPSTDEETVWRIFLGPDHPESNQSGKGDYPSVHRPRPSRVKCIGSNHWVTGSPVAQQPRDPHVAGGGAEERAESRVTWNHV